VSGVASVWALPEGSPRLNQVMQVRSQMHKNRGESLSLEGAGRHKGILGRRRDLKVGIGGSFSVTESGCVANISTKRDRYLP
jgi:hypothetical protein